MYILAISAICALLLVVQFNAQSNNYAVSAQAIEADSLASNFWMYQRSLAQYISSNPSFTGTIPDNILTFPLGYVRNSAWTNTVANGTLFVYSTATLDLGATSAICQWGGMSATIGIARNQSLLSLTSSTYQSTYALPPSIPNGAVVSVGI